MSEPSSEKKLTKIRARILMLMMMMMVVMGWNNRKWWWKGWWWWCGERCELTEQKIRGTRPFYISIYLIDIVLRILCVRTDDTMWQYPPFLSHWKLNMGEMKMQASCPDDLNKSNTWYHQWQSNQDLKMSLEQDSNYFGNTRTIRSYWWKQNGHTWLSIT